MLVIDYEHITEHFANILLSKFLSMNRTVLILLFLCFSVLSYAQNGKIINKDFDIENYNSVAFDLYGETIYEPWEADYVLVETTVKLWDTPKRLFQDHINKGRYYCHIKAEGEAAKIASIPVERQKLSARESVVSVVYYPQDFVFNGSTMQRQGSAVSSKEEEK